MSELAFLALDYALEHVLASAVVALVASALCRSGILSPAARAGVLFAALMLCVLGPALSLPRGADGAAVAASGTAYAPDAANAAPPPRTIAIDASTATFLAALWLAGMAWQLGRLARGRARLRRVVAASTRARALENAHRRSVPRGVEIRLHASFGPAVTGIVRPKILLPERLAASLPHDALRAVLLHEAAHVRRHDLAAHAMQKIVEAVFWWNPLVRRIGAALDDVREIASDVAASRSCDTAADYADALLTAIEHLAAPRDARPVPALCVADASQALERRIDGVLRARETSGTAAAIAWTGALVLLCAACAAAAAVAPALSRAPVAGSGSGVAIAAMESTAGFSGDDYRRAAAAASRDYTAAANAADATYRRQAAELDGAMPSDVYDRRLSHISEHYDRAMSAAKAEYDTAMMRAIRAFESASPSGRADTE